MVVEVLTVARVRKPHGLAGEVLVHADTDDGAEVFRPDRRFEVRPAADAADAADRLREVTLVESRPHRGGYLLRFAEVTGRDMAQALVGAELAVGRETLRPLAEDEFFLHELVGLEVVDETAGALGPIVDVYDTAGQVLAAVRVEGRERLFPLHREVVRAVDVELRRMDVALPPGLLEL